MRLDPDRGALELYFVHPKPGQVREQRLSKLHIRHEQISNTINHQMSARASSKWPLTWALIGGLRRDEDAGRWAIAFGLAAVLASITWVGMVRPSKKKRFTPSALKQQPSRATASVADR